MQEQSNFQISFSYQIATEQTILSGIQSQLEQLKLDQFCLKIKQRFRFVSYKLGSTLFNQKIYNQNLIKLYFKLVFKNKIMQQHLGSVDFFNIQTIIKSLLQTQILKMLLILLLRKF
ncbi:unnamed protein product [Paramecium sonneborni]|uniref:Uncharacterized protein n=1 Tax=Paramecium sonneborni TaxID=65129 RepID=A0A8S1LAT2_9CILI|nr:unnamed protein product [Paramecium sonneborni]